MDQLFKNFPPTLIALGLLVLGVLGLLILNPPRSLCDTQIDELKKSIGNFLYEAPNGKGKEKLPPQVIGAIENCKLLNSPGGCLLLFSGTRKFFDSLQALNQECLSQSLATREFKNLLVEVFAVMPRLAWGDTPPQSMTVSTQWLDSSDLNLFCKTKQFLKNNVSENTFNQIQEKNLKDLPGSDKISREDLWRKSLYSLRCEQFL